LKEIKNIGGPSPPRSYDALPLHASLLKMAEG